MKKRNENKYDEYNNTRVTTGILKNLTGENYKIVNFHDGIYAADLFSERETNSKGERIGKRVLDVVAAIGQKVRGQMRLDEHGYQIVFLNLLAR